MNSPQKDRERFLVALNAICGGNSDAWNEVPVVATKCQMQAGEGRGLAIQLSEMNLAEYRGTTAGQVRITATGLDEVYRLSLPLWKRVVMDRRFEAAVIAFFSAVIGSVITVVLTRLLTHPS